MTSDQVGCIIGVEAAALRMELRAAIGAPNASFTSCAVVGSSGSLLSDRHGQEIDQHDAVIRFNTAPVRGFEPVVGSRTTVRLVNSQAMVSVIKRCSPYGTCTPNVTCCSDPHETLFINSGRDGVANCLRKVCGDVPSVSRGMPTLALQTHPFLFEAPSGKRGTSILSGIFGLALATALCTGPVDIYGFTSRASTASASQAVNALDREGDGFVSVTRYHYYDNCAFAPHDPIYGTASHFEHGWLNVMNSRYNTTMRFRQPKAAHHSPWSANASSQSSGCHGVTDALASDATLFGDLAQRAPAQHASTQQHQASSQHASAPRHTPTHKAEQSTDGYRTGNTTYERGAEISRNFSRLYRRPDGTVRSRALLRIKAQAELEKKCKGLEDRSEPPHLSKAADGSMARRAPAQSRLVLTLLNQAEAFSLSDPKRSHKLLVQAIHMFAETHML